MSDNSGSNNSSSTSTDTNRTRKAPTKKSKAPVHQAAAKKKDVIRRALPMHHERPHISHPERELERLDKHHVVRAVKQCIQERREQAMRKLNDNYDRLFREIREESVKQVDDHLKKMERELLEVCAGCTSVMATVMMYPSKYASTADLAQALWEKTQVECDDKFGTWLRELLGDFNNPDQLLTALQHHIIDNCQLTPARYPAPLKPVCEIRSIQRYATTGVGLSIDYQNGCKSAPMEYMGPATAPDVFNFHVRAVLDSLLRGIKEIHVMY